MTADFSVGACQGVLNLFTFRDVANIALNYVLLTFLVKVGHYFNFAHAAVPALKRQILIADIMFLSQLGEHLAAHFLIFQQTDFPKLLADKLIVGITEEFD